MKIVLRLGRNFTIFVHMDKQVNSANDPSTSCTNMVNFGPVTPEIEV